jgi:tetratricopeptide (TPR) repeat protein
MEDFGKLIESYCSNCGHRVKVEDNFCNKCGNKIERQEVKSEKKVVEYSIKVIHCSCCGHSVKAEDKLCPNCDSSLEQQLIRLNEIVKEDLSKTNISRCSFCGDSVSVGDQFCYNCGNNFKRQKIKSQENIRAKYIYTGSAVYAGILFGQPLAIGIFMSKNFKVLKNEKGSNYALILGILGTILWVLFPLIIPEFNIHKSYQYLIFPLILYTLIEIISFEVSQRSEVAELINKGAQEESAWKVLGFILLNLLISITLFLIVYSTSFTSITNDDGIEEYNKGLGYQETNQITLAEQQYKLAIQKNPNLAEAYLNLGLIYLNNGWLQGAEEMTLKSISIFESSNKTIVSGNTPQQSLSIDYNNLGAIEMAKALQYETNYDYSSAKYHWKNGIVYFNKAIQLDPTNSKAQSNINRFSNAYDN